MNKVVFIKNGLVKYEDYKNILNQLEDKVRECKLKDKEIERLKKDYGRLMQDNAYTLELERRNEKAIEYNKKNIHSENLDKILQGSDKE